MSPGSAASPEPTAPERVNVELDEILATKLSLPRIRSDFLPRPQLVDALEEGVTKELVLVCTPAGFGKTTLLATWAQQRNRPVAWLSLDPGDNDPTRFWRYVIAAVGRVRPGFGSGVLARLAAADQPSPEAVATALANAFAALPENLVLVLDDYHVLETTPVHDALGLLLGRLPPQACVVISTRSDPPLPLAQLRARDQLLELREADLRFTTEEVACLLREVWGLDLTMEAVAALGARTEGWVAGLQLAAISLRGRSDPARLVDAFAGSNRYVVDYLTEEVLERQPGDLRSFLLDTSGLERLSGPFCDAVTGRCDGQQILEALERANLFVVPLDDDRRWYRYHQLFADMLRVRLQRLSPQRLPELHRRAAAWCEAHGLIDDAVGYALGAGDPSWAAGLVEQHTDAMLRRGEGATLQRWLARLPPEVMRSRPRLCLAQAVAAFNAGRLDVVEPLLQDAERATARGEPPESRGGAATSALGNVPAAVALLRASLAGARGDAERTIQFAQQAQAHLDADDRAARFAVRWNLAIGDWMRGRMPQAERALAAIVADGWEADQPHLALTACGVLGRVQHARGRLGGALGTYRRALGAVEAAGGPVSPAAGMLHAGTAEVLYERNELDHALRHATEGVALCRQLAHAQSLAIALAALAWIRNATGDPAGARQAITEAARAVPSRDIVSLHNPVPAARARLLLLQGELADAVRWTEEQEMSAEDQPSYPRELDYLVLARVLLARDAPDRALSLLAWLQASAMAQRRVGSAIAIQALRALALQALGEETRAIDALVDALSLARPRGFVRVFVDEGIPMAALLRKLAALRQRGRVSSVSETLMDYIGRLLGAFELAGAGEGRASRVARSLQVGLAEPLTDRELEVLRLLGAGRRNRQIADELVVELDTVKKHVSHIFRKLRASNRAQAVAHARELGLLQ